MTIIEPIDRATRAQRNAIAMECRASRHWMQRQIAPPGDWEPPGTPLWAMAKYVLHLECQRCGTWRHIAIDHTGQILAQHYRHPDFYRRNGEGRPTGEALRLWQVRQLTRDRRALRSVNGG
jgi:hypothetical protein